MTTIEEIEQEIAALKEAREIIEQRTGDKCENIVLLTYIDRNLNVLKTMMDDEFSDLPVHPHEPEFDKYSKWDR